MDVHIKNTKKIDDAYIGGLYSQKIKTLKTSKLKTRKIKSLMEEDVKIIVYIVTNFS